MLKVPLNLDQFSIDLLEFINRILILNIKEYKCNCVTLRLTSHLLVSNYVFVDLHNPISIFCVFSLHNLLTSSY